MWNASWVQSLPAARSLLSNGDIADAALDLVVWFAACALLGVGLSWLHALARRRHQAPPMGPRLVRTLARRAATLAGA